MTGSNLLEDYFNYQKKYQELYGINTIVFMQVGSFHEAYQTESVGFDLHIISEIINIVVTKKNKSIPVDIKNPYMMGFPSVSLPKFLKILVENSFTVIIIDQVTPPPNPKREITGIYSPGTFFEEINNPDSNYITSIYVEEVDNNIYLGGISIIDVSTGKCLLSETYSQKTDDKIALDDITKLVQSYSTKEIIITTNNLVNITVEKLILYLEMSNKLYHHRELNKHMIKLNYQNEILKKIYGNRNDIIEYLGLENLNSARISLVVLLNYINEHNKSLIKNLHNPTIIEKHEYLHLGNNAIYQLNIFNNDIKNTSNIFLQGTQYKCLFDVINKTSTSMGRRFLQNNLINPLIDIEKINQRYEYIEYLIEQDRWIMYENILKEIPDIERYVRKISIQNINPMDLNNCINGIKRAYELIKLDKDKINLLNDTKKLINKFDRLFNYEELNKYIINDITGNIFIDGLFKDIDKLCHEIKNCDNFINILANTISSILNKQMPKKKRLDDDDSDEQLVKVECNDRDGYYLTLTKRRAEVFKDYLEKHKSIDIGNDKIKDIEFRSLPKGNTCKLFIPEIQIKSNKIIDLTNELKTEIKNKYIELLNELYINCQKIFDEIINYISFVDFCKSGAKLSIQNKYNRPIINNKHNNVSYLDTIDMRHPICEKLLIDAEYIPISIKLVPDHQGILLFGLNSVGKSTLQKSIGINVILAQIGYYVPASSFEYYPYNSLMTRISANDNLFKGLSSFSLELQELRAILKRSNENTLIIADEVCKGTEHQSSLIIVMTMLEILAKNRCSFITATHLHDLVSIPRLHNLKEIKLYHLHVEFDEKTNKLIYERSLKPGSGENFYGLNVAKCLINDSEFLNRANEIKNEISPELLVSYKKSRYNSNLFINECQICGYKPTKEYDRPLETHHINFQKDTDKNGFLLAKPHIHKNHKSNLCVLCFKCHDKIDTKELFIYGYEDTINGSVLKYKLDDHISIYDKNYVYKKLIK